MVIEELLDIISEYTDLDIESIDKELQNVSSEFGKLLNFDIFVCLQFCDFQNYFKLKSNKP